MQITSFWEQLPGCEALAEEAPAAPRCCRRWQPAAAAAALARQARVAAQSNGQITEELVGFICLTVLTLGLVHSKREMRRSLGGLVALWTQCSSLGLESHKHENGADGMGAM